MDLRGLVKVREELSLMRLAENVKKIVKKVFQGTLPLLRRCGYLIEEAMSGNRENQFTLVGVVV